MLTGLSSPTALTPRPAALTLNDSLIGKRIKLTASALDNTVEWVSSDSVTAAGEYNLLRVIATTPQINSDSTHLVSGDSVKATAQAKRADGSTTNGIDVTGQATVAWYAAEDAKAPAADWTLLSDMSGADGDGLGFCRGQVSEGCRHERQLDGRACLGQSRLSPRARSRPQSKSSTMPIGRSLLTTAPRAATSTMR